MKASMWGYLSVFWLTILILLAINIPGWHGIGGYVVAAMIGLLAVLTVRSILAAVRAEIHETRVSETREASQP